MVLDKLIKRLARALYDITHLWYIIYDINTFFLVIIIVCTYIAPSHCQCCRFFTMKFEYTWRKWRKISFQEEITSGVSCSLYVTSDYAKWFLSQPNCQTILHCNVEESSTTEDWNKRIIARSSAVLQHLADQFILSLFWQKIPIHSFVSGDPQRFTI